FVPGYSLVEKNKNKIFTTSLINDSFPLIRYEITDSVKWTNKPLVDELEGRIDDFIILKDGSRIKRLGKAFINIKGILYTQIIQNSLQEIEINIVINDLFSNEVKTAFLHNLNNLIDNKIKVKINIIVENEIIKTAKGKYKF